MDEFVFAHLLAIHRESEETIAMQLIATANFWMDRTQKRI